jgi:hypothetical protein
MTSLEKYIVAARKNISLDPIKVNGVFVPALDSPLSKYPLLLHYHPMVTTSCVLCCPIHDCELTDSGLWSDGDCLKRYPPRLLYGVSRNVLLISRLYYCKSSQCDPYRAHDASILLQLTDHLAEFVLFHQCGVTIEAYNLIVYTVITGIFTV